jgi:hypothetical protein
MQAQTSPGDQTPATPVKLPALSGGSSGRLGTILGAVAVALALVAIGVAFLVPGPTGPTGPGGTGSTGIPNVTWYAVVASTGTLSRGNGANTSTLESPGHYQVTFEQILYGCTYSASLGTTDAGSQAAGTATVTKATNSIWGLNVSTFNSTGVATDESFHLAVSCPGGISAVLAANGSFVSGAGVVNTVAFGAGAYSVDFDQNVASCAYVVGLGASGTPPAGSATTAERAGNADGVWVNTYNATGAMTAEPFHLTVYC